MSTVEETITGTQETTPTDSPVQTVPSAEATSNTAEFTRGAVEALGNRVRVVDQDEGAGLDLFCYVKCTPTDEGLIRECRGVVFHEDELVMKAFPYTVECNLSDSDRARFEEAIGSSFKECSFYDAHEGALIRMFNFGGKWYTSTHRKLNAFRSKWASRESFGSSLKKALDAEVENNEELRKHIPEGDANLLERFQSTLDPSKQYMFLVRHSAESRIVCQAPARPTLYHVGTFVEGELVMTEDVHIPYPRKHAFLSVVELYDYVDRSDVRDLQGIIAFAPDNRQYKVMQRDYQTLFRARGNEPSIKFRYLQVRMESEQVRALQYLYPDMCDTFDEYENTLYEIAKSIHRSYVHRFIKKIHVTVPKEEYAVVRECHDWHREDRTQNRINLDKVWSILNNQPPTNLNRMIRHFRAEQTHRKEIKETRTRSNSQSGRSVGPSPGLLGTSPGNTAPSPLLLGNPARKRVLPPAPRSAPARKSTN